MLDSRHCEVINAHPVSQADTLVFEGHIIVMIVPAENGFCTFKGDHGIKKFAWIVGTADLVNHFLTIFSKKVSNFIASLLV